MEHLRISRRGFLASAAATGLVLGFNISTGRAAVAKEAVSLNAWLVIEPDDTIKVMVAFSEMGQGVYTSVPKTIAEELEVDWSRIEPVKANSTDQVANPLGRMLTVGSTTTQRTFDQLRQVGATARVMLEQAAAKRWGVDSGAVHAQNGTVVNEATGEVLRYGDLAVDAAKEVAPDNIPLKDPSEWKLLGVSTDRFDIPLKVRGEAEFGIDVKVEGMLVATLTKCPVFGGKLVSVDEAPAMAVRGVKSVLNMGDALAVIADGYWPAKKGLNALQPIWDLGDFATGSTDALLDEFAATLADNGAVAETTGDIDQGFKAATQVYSADYRVPYLAHATMEPMNATAHVTDEGVKIWAPVQSPGPHTQVIAKHLGIDESTVMVQPTFLGGGFGRRYEFDIVTAAVDLSKAVDAPIKLILSREQDIAQGYYRPGAVSRAKAGVDSDGRITAWDMRLACSSINSRLRPETIKNGIDGSSVWGATELPYDLPNRQTDYRITRQPIPVAHWRSVGYSQNCFFVETFLDELAHELKRDPLEYRLSLLTSPDFSDNAKVLATVAEEANWGTAPEGHGQGLALSHALGSVTGEVVELSVSEDKQITLHKITVAIDPGTVIDPRNLVAQIESAVVWGLTAVVYGKISVKNGVPESQNFYNYKMAKLNQLPDIDVHLVPSGRPIGGVGEAGVPPLAPALCNALFAATGERVRSLPLMDHGYSLGSAWT